MGIGDRSAVASCATAANVHAAENVNDSALHDGFWHSFGNTFASHTWLLTK